MAEWYKNSTQCQQHIKACSSIYEIIYTIIELFYGKLINYGPAPMAEWYLKFFIMTLVC